MSDLCTPTFSDLAGRLGFSCDEAGGLVEFRSPFALENWTLPVLELTTANGGLVIDGLGLLRIHLSAAATAVLGWTRAAWDLELTFADGTVTRFAQGEVEVGLEGCP